MKLYKLLRKNWLILLVLLIVILYFLINNRNEGFQMNSTCTISDETIPGFCYVPGTGKQQEKLIADVSNCYTIRCPRTGGTIYDLGMRDKRCYNRNNRKDIVNAIITPTTNYNCPANYNKVGNFMCNKTVRGTMKCPDGYYSYGEMCYSNCPNNNVASNSYNNPDVRYHGKCFSKCKTGSTPDKAGMCKQKPTGVIYRVNMTDQSVIGPVCR